jgi:hypothetical protein
MIEVLSVIVAAGVAFAAGAGWYMLLADRWMSASGVPQDPDGKPQGGQNPAVMALTFVMQLLVAGMMRHVFEASGVTTFGAGAIFGAGIGLFFITPWIAINNANSMRPAALTVIDGGYATLACAIMGAVLALF